MPFIRSISGLRATVEDSLPDDLIIEYAASFTNYLPPGPIAIGRDGRPSGEHIEKIIIETLTKLGREVHNLRIVPTPTVQLYVEKSDCSGGIAITASHNPSEWNGMKFINGSGVFLDANENKDFWKIVDEEIKISNEEDVDTAKIISVNGIELHIKSVLDLPIFTKTDTLEKFKKRNYRVVVDAVNASGSIAVPKLLEILGCEVIQLFCDESGVFPHTPEPLPENLSKLAEAVKKNNADLGIAVDPDADRLVLVNEKGETVFEEYTIALAVESVLSSKDLFTSGKDVVVINYSTTRVVEDLADKYNAKCFRAPVGEINVVKRMKKFGAIVGGEGSGGVILPACHYGRDSLVGIALILFLMVNRKETVSQLIDYLPHYEMLKFKQQFSRKLKRIIDVLLKEFPEWKPNFEDGIRIEFEKSWLQLRTSNTEPIVRIIAETPVKAQTESLVEKAKSILNSEFKIKFIRRKYKRKFL